MVEVTLPDSESEGSVRAAIQERQEKAAETPVLGGLEGEEEPGAHTPVTAITGIGPAIAGKLEEELEVETIADLLAAGAEAIMQATGKGDEVVGEWLKQAEELAGEEAHAGHDHDDSEE